MLAITVVVVFSLAQCAGISHRQPDGSGSPPLPTAGRIAAVRAYITDSWQALTRSHADIRQAVVDQKVTHQPGEPWLLYISARESYEAVHDKLQQALADESLAEIRIEQLLPTTPASAARVDKHGLLYLPYQYVVPGGRFNEMYGWDSYFIQLGLLREGLLELAKGMTDNFLYEIEHYGAILNANRTYYLTRSQPPFLTGMILNVFAHTGDRQWLASTQDAIDAYYSYWTTPPHAISGLGLSRYHGLGRGPAPEVVASERDEAGRSHYERARAYYRNHDVRRYTETLYYDASADSLTEVFYRGDRAMRESGFDPSNRYGPFSVAIIDYVPVCLNSLLYRMETEAARICEILDQPTRARAWTERAETRRFLINQYLWQEEAGLYLDYDHVNDRASEYEFATTFYPLWVGVATIGQARAVVRNLYRFEAPGGLLTSTTISGSQWDAPFGWAPLQLIAVEGLRRYGFDKEADRLAHKFIGLVTKEYEEHQVILEKYDLIQRESAVEYGIKFGYSSNEIGFGWTNAVFLELLAGLKN